MHFWCTRILQVNYDANFGECKSNNTLIWRRAINVRSMHFSEPLTTEKCNWTDNNKIIITQKVHAVLLRIWLLLKLFLSNFSMRFYGFEKNGFSLGRISLIIAISPSRGSRWWRFARRSCSTFVVGRTRTDGKILTNSCCCCVRHVWIRLSCDRNSGRH